MEYKRLEIYLWWTCNNKCIFCIEMKTMEKMWKVQVTEKELLKKLIKFKKEGYNHVTYLWGEPFIQKNFWFALKIWKKLWYKILVTTNASMIQYENISKSFLPYIDQLIISIPIIDKKIQPIINNTKAIINFDKVFINIKKYWKWDFLKINTVINPLNINELTNIVNFIGWYWVKELSFTYPDLDYNFYWKKYLKENVAVTYFKAVKSLLEPINEAEKYWINVKITDIPFCCLPNESFIKMTDDYDYGERMKINDNEEELKRKSSIFRSNNKDVIVNSYENDKTKESSTPRLRKYSDDCKKCKFYWECWWFSEVYENYYWLDEIKPIKK